MGTDIHALLAIDCDDPCEKPPFARDPSYWSLWDVSDAGLDCCKDYGFYAAIAGVRNDKEKAPLIAPRGLPPHHPEAPIVRIYEHADYAIGWLTLSEIEAAMAHHGLDRSIRC